MPRNVESQPRQPIPSVGGIPCRMIEEIEPKKEKEEVMRDVMGKAIGILSEYGQPANTTDQFGTTMKRLMNPRAFCPFGKKEEVISTSLISREIPDEEGKLTKITVTSHKEEKSSKVKGVTIIVSNLEKDGEQALLLVERGEKIIAEVWRHYDVICWEVNTVNVSMEKFESASRNLELLHKSLVSKNN